MGDSYSWERHIWVLGASNPEAVQHKCGARATRALARRLHRAKCAEVSWPAVAAIDAACRC
jgi:hypothetical protein